MRIRSDISLRASLCLLRNISLTEASNDSTLTKFHHGKEAAESTRDETSGLVGERPWGELDEECTIGNPWQFVFRVIPPTLQPNIPKLQDLSASTFFVSCSEFENEPNSAGECRW
jgi:hypothetical protein